MSAIDSGELLYNLLRFAFAGGLLFFLAMMVRVMLREIDTATRDTIDSRQSNPQTAWLMVVDGGTSPITAGQRAMITRRATVGRSPECDIVFEDPSVSSVHAAIFLNGSDWMVEDYESMNGTYVDGRLVRDQSAVTDGDVLQFGRIRTRLMC